MTPYLPTDIEQRPIGDLLPYARNARTHSEGQIMQVAASIREFGWTNPVLVGADGVIIGGHARVLAATKLEMSTVPVIVLGHLDEAQRRAYVLADNQLALNAGWDDALLREELQAIQNLGYELGVIGFSDDELSALFAPIEGVEPSPVGEEAAVPEPPVNPVTRPGDVWLIGQHRLTCGDCRDAGVVSALFAGVKASLAITSPP